MDSSADDGAGANDRANGPASSTSLLLSLPTELRNLIYRFALTHEGGLVKEDVFTEHIEDVGGRFRAVGPQNEKYDPNPLKWVCRQLYHETTGLLLGLNKITFEKPNATLPNATFVFNQFLEYECSESIQAQLTNIVLRVHIGTWGSSQSNEPNVKSYLYFWAHRTAVRGFCESHPNTSIEVWFYFFETIEKTMTAGLFLEKFLCGSEPDWANPTDNAYLHMDLAGEDLDMFRGLFPTNINFHIVHALDEKDCTPQQAVSLDKWMFDGVRVRLHTRPES